MADRRTILADMILALAGDLDLDRRVQARKAIYALIDHAGEVGVNLAEQHAFDEVAAMREP